MREIVAIDGPRGVGKTAVAAEVARRLGWPLLGAPETGAETAGRAVSEGAGWGQGALSDARWKFFLDADPRERARRLARRDGEGAGREVELLAELLSAGRPHWDGAPLRLPADAILIDTTDLTPDVVAAMIAALVQGDPE